MNKISNINNVTTIAICTSILCIVAPFSIPIGTVPISFATLIIALNSYILGYKKACISCILYILIGIIGLPVFSGFGAGIGVIIGPTGGYILGYLFLSLVVGWTSDNFINKKTPLLLSLFIGYIITYTCGTIWLSKALHLSFYNALFVGVIPFIIGDIGKILITVIIAPLINKRLCTIKK